MLRTSVIIPCFNAADTLARALDSCIAQPEAAQIIVVDDGSTDASREIAAHYAAHYAAQSPRVMPLALNQNAGAARARNWGAMHADHDVLAFLDADDEYLPGALQMSTAFLHDNPRQPSIRLDVDFHNFPADITTHPDFRDHAMALSNTVPSSLVIRRSIFGALGGFPHDDVFRRFGGEDGALSFTLRLTSGNLRLIDRPRVRMHHHPGIHAERYFRVMMGMIPVPEWDPLTTEASLRFVRRCTAALTEIRNAEFDPPEFPPDES